MLGVDAGIVAAVRGFGSLGRSGDSGVLGPARPVSMGWSAARKIRPPVDNLTRVLAAECVRAVRAVRPVRRWTRRPE